MAHVDRKDGEPEDGTRDATFHDGQVDTARLHTL